MEHMEQKMDEQIEGALYNQKEAYERISQLENAIKSALKIHCLWLPGGEYREEYIEENKALNTMYKLFKSLTD